MAVRLRRLYRMAVAPTAVRTLAVASILGLAAALTIALLAAVSLARLSPAWWRTVEAANPDTVALAQRIERGVVSHVHSLRPEGEPWTVSISAAQANAWLNTKLRDWMASRDVAWPERVAELQADFNEGEFRIGARISGDSDADRIVAATAVPTVDERGALWLPLDAARAGRLDLPRGWTVARLREWLPEETLGAEAVARVLDALSGDAPLFQSASIKLEDGRRVRLVRITATGGKLLLTCETDPPGARAAAGEG